MPFHEKTKPTTTDLFQAYLNRVWRPQLSITGMDGLPETSKAGNVLRPETIAKVSLRIPPTLDAEKAKNDLIQVIKKENLLNLNFFSFLKKSLLMMLK